MAHIWHSVRFSPSPHPSFPTHNLAERQPNNQFRQPTPPSFRATEHTPHQKDSRPRLSRQRQHVRLSPLHEHGECHCWPRSRGCRMGQGYASEGIHGGAVVAYERVVSRWDGGIHGRVCACKSFPYLACTCLWRRKYSELQSRKGGINGSS